MSSLPVEILEAIFAELETDDRVDLLRTARVCRRWHAVAISKVYANMVFASQAQAERASRAFAEMPSLPAENIRGGAGSSGRIGSGSAPGSSSGPGSGQGGTGGHGGGPSTASGVSGLSG